MKRLMSICLVVAVAVASGSVAKASITIIAEPDAYANGADISTAFEGLTLSPVDAGLYNGVLDGKVYARVVANPLHATTGTMVFGNNLTGIDGDNNPLNEVWYDYQDDAFSLRADFDRPRRAAPPSGRRKPPPRS